MTDTESSNLKIILSIVAILLIVAVYFVFKDDDKSEDGEIINNQAESNNQETIAVVENLPIVQGKASVPQGFPIEIPIEKDRVFESANTLYPNQSAKQLSLSYNSSKTVAQKYTEYKEYLIKANSCHII